MDKFIGLSVPNLKGNELKYVTEAIETEWVSTAGPYITTFEEKIAEYLKVEEWDCRITSCPACVWRKIRRESNCSNINICGGGKSSYVYGSRTDFYGL